MLHRACNVMYDGALQGGESGVEAILPDFIAQDYSEVWSFVMAITGAIWIHFGNDGDRCVFVMNVFGDDVLFQSVSKCFFVTISCRLQGKKDLLC